jgi:hypothetical protein
MVHRRTTLATVALLVALAALAYPAGIATAQDLDTEFEVIASKPGGDFELKGSLGNVCLWDNGTWTMSAFADSGFWLAIKKKLYLTGGVVDVEVATLIFNKKKGDIDVGAAGASELPGTGGHAGASLKTKKKNGECAATRETGPRPSILQTLR